MGETRSHTSPYLPEPAIQTSMSIFRWAGAPSSSVGISRTLKFKQKISKFKQKISTSKFFYLLPMISKVNVCKATTILCLRMRKYVFQISKKFYNFQITGTAAEGREAGLSDAAQTLPTANWFFQRCRTFPPEKSKIPTFDKAETIKKVLITCKRKDTAVQDADQASQSTFTRSHE